MKKIIDLLGRKNNSKLKLTIVQTEMEKSVIKGQTVSVPSKRRVKNQNQLSTW